MKFIRVKGRIVPIKDGNDGNAQKADQYATKKAKADFKTKHEKKYNSTSERVKRGAGGGLIAAGAFTPVAAAVGAIAGSVFGKKAGIATGLSTLAAGTAIGAYAMQTKASKGMIKNSDYKKHYSEYMKKNKKK